MIRSMTGFARREQTDAFGQLAWELRTVNHRYLEMSLRLPEDFRTAESAFRQVIGGAVRRGKVEASLYFRPAAAGAPELDLNEELLNRVVDRAIGISRRLGGVGHINAIDVLRWPGVVREAERDSGPQLAAAHRLLEQALEALAESRHSEGERIAELLRTRADAVEQIANELTARLPAIRERIQARLNERLGQVTVDANSERLEQEIVIALQKMDVDEELDRLRQPCRRAAARSSPRANRRAGGWTS